MAATAPAVVTVPGASSTPSAPATVSPATGGNKFGSPLKSFIVAGFTSDATNLNATWNPITAPTIADTQYSMPSPAEDNYFGYVTDRWQIYAEHGVTTNEVKAEMVSSNSTDPTGTYTGVNDQAGDTVTITGIPPAVLTV